jgi:hypothetical protein
MFPKMMARMSVIPWLGSFAFNRVLIAHYFPINKKKTPSNLEVSGFNRVGLLFDGSSGRWPNYPSVSHPRFLIVCRNSIHFASPLEPRKEE